MHFQSDEDAAATIDWEEAMSESTSQHKTWESQQVRKHGRAKTMLLYYAI